MSLLGHGGDCMPDSTIRECKRDYEGEISRLKSRLKVVGTAQTLAVELALNPMFYSLTDSKCRASLAMIIGNTLVEGTNNLEKLDKLIEEYSKES